ncbi:MAG: deaminase [Bacteroidota bacterium]
MVNNYMYNNKLERPFKLLYLFTLCCLTASIPFSNLFTSISIMLVGLVWIAGAFVFPYKKRLKANSEVWWFVLIYVLHLVWLWNTGNFDYATEDLRKKLPLLFLPVFIASLPALNRFGRNVVLHVFLSVMFISGVFVFLAKAGLMGNEIVNPRDYSVFINHIRLSLMMSLAIFVALWLFKHTNNVYLRVAYLLSIVLNIASMVTMQVITGLGITLITFVIMVILYHKTIKNTITKRLIFAFVIAVPLLVAAFTGKQIYDFYHPDNPYPQELNLETSRGNNYTHNLHSKLLENGNYVYRFLAFNELEKAWNKRSKVKYDSLSQNGYEIKHILIRYLTSKGEFKDAEAVNELSQREIKAIESGVTNHRFIDQNKINSRIYTLIWQVHVYYTGGNPSGKSLIQRLIYLETGWRIASNNLLTGVGTGDVNDCFKHQYREDNTPLLPEYRRRTHNQYLTMLIAFGIPGFILFLLGWIMPVIRKNGMKKYFFAAFFIIASVSMLNEDTLETSTGASFVAYFYSLLLWGINHKTMFQEKFMKKAIQLAKENIPSGNGPFGAVIVKDGKVIAEASNSVTRTNDPTAHAEINAIRKATNKLNTFDLSGCEIYASCEPCPMCLGAIYWARIEKLYFASGREEAAKAGFSDGFIYDELKKPFRERSIPTRQMMQDEAEVVFKTWNDFEDKIMY